MVIFRGLFFPRALYPYKLGKETFVPSLLNSLTPQEKFETSEESSIFRLKTHIFRLQIRIFRLQIYIFSLKIELSSEALYFLFDISPNSSEFSRFIGLAKRGNGEI